MLLDNTTAHLRVTLAAAVDTAQAEWTATWVEIHDVNETARGDFDAGLTTGTTPVDLVGPPATGYKRQIKDFTLYNADTAQITATFDYWNGTVSRRRGRVVLEPNEFLEWEDGGTWRVYDARGQPKPTAPPDFLYSVAAGRFPQLSLIHVRGFNLDVDIGTDEDVIPWGGQYAFQATAVALEVVSTSAADAAAGTGARTIQVETLDGAFVEVIQTVTLNGTTPVALTGTHRRVNFAFLLTAGSGTTNAGDITVRVAGAGATQALIPANYGAQQQALYTVPAGKVVYILSFYTEMARVTGADAVEFYLQTRSLAAADEPVLRGRRITLYSGGASLLNYEHPVPRQIVGPHDTWIRSGGATSNNTTVGAAYNFLLEDV